MIVEFFGPSGVGKTTLLNRVVQHGLPPQWRTVTKPALHEIAARINPPDFDRLETALLEMRLANLLQHKITPLEVYHLTNLAYNHMALQATYRRLKPRPNLVLDEHLMQLFLPELITLIDNYAPEFSPVLQHRAVVFVKDREEKILSNLKSRAKTADYKPLLAERSNEELLVRMQDFQTGGKALMDFLKTQGVPVLEIDLNQSDGVDATSRFIKSLGNHSG
jgi:hypothetical protein